MPLYTNVMQGIELIEGEKHHFYQRISVGYGNIELDLDELGKFLQQPKDNGIPLIDCARNIVSIYNISKRLVDMRIFNVSRDILREAKRWDMLAAEFDPIFILSGRTVSRTQTSPMNLSADQVQMFEKELKKYLL